MLWDGVEYDAFSCLLMGSLVATWALLIVAFGLILIHSLRKRRINWDTQQITQELLPSSYLPGPSLAVALGLLALSPPHAWQAWRAAQATLGPAAPLLPGAAMLVGLSVGYWLGGLVVQGHLARCAESLATRERMSSYCPLWHGSYRKFFIPFLVTLAVVLLAFGVSMVGWILLPEGRRPLVIEVGAWLGNSAILAESAGWGFRHYLWARMLPKHPCGQGRIRGCTRTDCILS